MIKYDKRELQNASCQTSSSVQPYWISIFPSSITDSITQRFIKKNNISTICLSFPFLLVCPSPPFMLLPSHLLLLSLLLLFPSTHLFPPFINLLSLTFLSHPSSFILSSSLSLLPPLSLHLQESAVL